MTQVVEFRRDSELVVAFLEAVQDYGPREVARMVKGVSPSDITRWRSTGGKRLSEDKRAALTQFLEHRAVRKDEGQPEEAAAVGGEVEDPLEEWVRDFERRVRNVGGKDERMSEYERRERKGDAIEAQIQALQQIGDPVPARLYELREMWRRGEL